MSHGFNFNPNKKAAFDNWGRRVRSSNIIVPVAPLIFQPAITCARFLHYWRNYCKHLRPYLYQAFYNHLFLAERELSLMKSFDYRGVDEYLNREHSASNNLYWMQFVSLLEQHIRHIQHHLRLFEEKICGPIDRSAVTKNPGFSYSMKGRYKSTFLYSPSSFKTPENRRASLQKRPVFPAVPAKFQDSGKPISVDSSSYKRIRGSGYKDLSRLRAVRCGKLRSSRVVSSWRDICWKLDCTIQLICRHIARIENMFMQARSINNYGQTVENVESVSTNNYEERSAEGIVNVQNADEFDDQDAEIMLAWDDIIAKLDTFNIEKK